MAREELNSQQVQAGERKEWAAGGPGKPVLVCGEQDFCEEARRELQRRRKELRVVVADNVQSARRLIETHAPEVILAEERVLANDAGSLAARREALSAAVSLLAGYAPLVWVGGAEEGAEISQAVRFAQVDFVPRSALGLPAAITMVERRLRNSMAAGKESGTGLAIVPLDELRLDDRGFGEVLRHELNNPLTGILGNAELLLLEVRRERLELPPQTRQRLETITALAVRMRETVRQLSDRWESAGGNLAAEKEHPGVQPQWTVSG